jgi:hypothetical protein
VVRSCWTDNGLHVVGIGIGFDVGPLLLLLVVVIIIIVPIDSETRSSGFGVVRADDAEIRVDTARCVAEGAKDVKTIAVSDDTFRRGGSRSKGNGFVRFPTSDGFGDDDDDDDDDDDGWRMGPNQNIFFFLLVVWVRT